MISIITITYNNLHGLKKTAESILKQTNQNYEWIIIDGNSYDGTKEYLPKLPAIAFSAPDDGIYDAMNKGIETANKDYLIFLNAGDTLADEDTIQRLNNDIHKAEFPDFIYGPSLEEREDHDPIMKSARKTKFLFWGMPTHHQAMIYKLSTLGDMRYELKYKISADYDLTCRFLNNAKTVHMTQYPICIFEPGGISQQAVKQGRLEQLEIRKTLKITPPICNHAIYCLQTAVMGMRLTMPTLYWAMRGNRAEKK